MGKIKIFAAKDFTRALVPALFLGLAVALGGLRSAAAWWCFSAAFLICLVVIKDEFSFSGLGAWALLGAWLLAGSAFSPEPLNSFWYFSRYLVLAAFFSSARGYGEKARMLWIGAVFLLAGTACLTIVWQVWAGGIAFKQADGMIGRNINYSSAFIAAAFAGIAALAIRTKDIRAKLAGLAALAVFGGAIIAVNSRGAVLGALGAVFYLTFSRRSFRPAVYFVLAALFAFVLLPAGQLSWVFKLYDPRSLGRFAIWGSALDAIEARPVFGWGLGLFERAFETLKFPFYNGISYYGHSTLHAHSEPLNLAAEAGLPAALLFVWAWFEGVSGGDKKDIKIIILKVFAISLFIQSSVDVIFYSGAIQILFFGTMGMLAGGAASLENSCAGPRTVKAAGVRLRTLALLCVCCAAAVLRVSFERSRACALNSAAPPAEREGCLRKASRFSPTDAALLEAAIPVSLALHGSYACAAARAEEAVLTAPKNPFHYFEAAGFYSAGGDAVSAKKMLFRALALEPNFLRARLALAGIAQAGGDGERAEREIKKIDAVLSRKPDISRASRYDLALLFLPRAPYDKIKKALGGRR
jgi:O-antigen ligase